MPNPSSPIGLCESRLQSTAPGRRSAGGARRVWKCTVSTIPGIPTNFNARIDLDIVRIATGGTYDDPGRLIGTEAAVSLRIIEKEPCRQAAIYAFELAKKMKKSVTSSS